MARTILITGGAGFIGSSLAVRLKAHHPGDRIIAFDSLRRRGSELNLPRLRASGVEFHHGDVREDVDLRSAATRLDVLVECSADPSVLSGRDGHVRFSIDTNLMGCVNCLELARDHQAVFLFLSTSRVYSARALAGLAVRRAGARFELEAEQRVPGVSGKGVSEEFPLSGPRTLYGATKLACELLIAEYVDMFGLRAVVNRCGVVSGPWQMGNGEQGVFAHWLMAHLFERPLTYIGYGGCGYQVRDVLHVDDLADLVDLQLAAPDACTGEVFNAGGGLPNSASLAEFTAICEELTGTKLAIASHPETRAGDVPLYISDNRKVERTFGWHPRRDVRQVASDLHQWLLTEGAAVSAALAR
jgi:CDP-paratose 2-epimerase